MNPVDEYLSRFDGEKKEWLATFVSFMRENFPGFKEVISYQMPMYKFEKNYIAFSVAKNHFTFHTLDFAMIETLKERLPKAAFGKGSAKVPFKRREDMPILFDAIREIAARTQAAKSSATE